ncbi:TAL effector repeat-containing protein [Mycetohabitans sp. B46]|uniref:TAL effector repeat-containing protein n=1 Tax=Mycetohabitans sp. B46 TaxID=2772536 RepID=UPI00307DBD2B
MAPFSQEWEPPPNPVRFIKIEKHYGGGTTLAFISNKHDELAQVLSRADILKIASYDCAAQALQAVLDCGPMLGERGFNQADIVRIAGNGGGAQALDSVLDVEPALGKRGFNRVDIAKIAGDSGAWHAQPYPTEGIAQSRPTLTVAKTDDEGRIAARRSG